MLFRINTVWLVVFFSFSCKTVTENKPITKQEEASYLSSEFEEFYESFHTDSLYQVSHIIFPLEGRTYDEDNNAVKILWTVDNWVLHKKFDDMGGTWTRSYSEFGGIVSEKISDDRSISNMERRFSKIQDEWHLIYYDPIHLTSK